MLKWTTIFVVNLLRITMRRNLLLFKNSLISIDLLSNFLMTPVHIWQHLIILFCLRHVFIFCIVFVKHRTALKISVLHEVRIQSKVHWICLIWNRRIKTKISLEIRMTNLVFIRHNSLRSYIMIQTIQRRFSCGYILQSWTSNGFFLFKETIPKITNIGAYLCHDDIVQRMKFRQIQVVLKMISWLNQKYLSISKIKEIVFLSCKSLCSKCWPFYDRLKSLRSCES